MSALRVNPKIQRLTDYKYLERKFDTGYLRQIDKHLVVRRGRDVLIANSFFINNVLKTRDKRVLALLEIFSEPIHFVVFLDRVSRRFRINLKSPSSRSMRDLKDLLAATRELIRYRFVVSEDYNEYAQLKRLRELLVARPRFSAVVYVLAALDCNFRCPDCYIYRDGWKKKKESLMSTKVFDCEHEFVMRMLPRELRQPLAYIFYGGEPLLNKPLIAHVSNRVRSLQKSGEYGNLRPMISVVTNASLLDADFIKLCRGNRISIGVSFDGVGTVHDAQRIWHGGKGTFKDVLRSIRLLEKENFNHGLSWTVGPKNIDHVSHDIGWVVRNMRTRNIFFNFMTSFSGPPYGDISEADFFKKMHKIYDTMRKYGIREGRVSRYQMLDKKMKTFLPYPFYCAAVGGGQFVLRPDGKIGMCQAGLMNDEEQWETPEEIGGVLQDPERLRWLARTPVFMKKCYLDCAYFSRCPGGCAYGAEKNEGRMYDPCSFDCTIEKFLVERALIEDYL